MEIIYTKDNLGKEILVNTTTDEQVMMEWEKPYMIECVNKLNPRGNVLEIGFGLGYSARQLCSFPEVTSYTVVESESIVWDKFELFEREINNLRPELQVTLIKKRWEDAFPELTTYDTIFFDDFPYEKYNSLYPYDKKLRLKYFIHTCLLNHTTIGSSIGYYLSFKSDFKYLDCVESTIYPYETSVPENCGYKKDNKTMFIPIITKIKEPEDNFYERYIHQFKD